MRIVEPGGPQGFRRVPTAGIPGTSRAWMQRGFPEAWEAQCLHLGMHNVPKRQLFGNSGSLENLPPLPTLYSNKSLTSLGKFLPYLKRTRFIGGDPFLVVGYER
jgi:hypothetical protein